MFQGSNLESGFFSTQKKQGTKCSSDVLCQVYSYYLALKNLLLDESELLPCFLPGNISVANQM